MTWKAAEYVLPHFDNDYVLLTPRDILTRDDTFINRPDMIRNLERIAPSVSDATLRFELNIYFSEVLRKKRKEISRKEKEDAAIQLIHTHPELIDYYLKYKEENEQEATSISKEVVREVTLLFNKQLHDLVMLLYEKTGFFPKSLIPMEQLIIELCFLSML